MYTCTRNLMLWVSSIRTAAPKLNGAQRYREPILCNHSSPSTDLSTLGPQFVGASIALRKSFPSQAQVMLPPRSAQSAVPSAYSPAPAQRSQRSNNGNNRKGKGKGSSSKSNPSVPSTSRHLAHEEILNDSALVDAMDQYRVRDIPASGLSPLP